MCVRIVVSAVACVTPAPCLANAEAARASTWSIQRTPNPAGATGSVLSGVSCTSPTACTAVGYFTNRGGGGVPLAERWNGTSWAIQRTPSALGATSSLLFDVSCASPTSCTAVGSATKRSGITVPLAERWNGTSWSIQRTPNPGRVNGSRVSYLGGVSCASTTTCTAVGFSGNSAGTSGVTLAERWNGAGWAIQQTPTPAAAAAVQLVGVSCASPTTCTAVGYFTIITGIDVMLAEDWNGTGWTIQRTLYPAGARYVQLAAVSCATPTSCTAVGLFNNVTGIDVTLAERSKDSNWAIQRIPYPAGAMSNTLRGVSCPSQTRCIAVGGFDNRAATGATLAERYS